MASATFGSRCFLDREVGAQLKRRQQRGGRGEEGDGFLDREVGAQLKPLPLSVAPLSSTKFPRPRGRGSIEAATEDAEQGGLPEFVSSTARSGLN